ncbi:unnamed protein product, partial [Tetraodon nigroviridis]
MPVQLVALMILLLSSTLGTTRPPSSSVRGGGIPGWCSQVTRALAWTDASCRSSGSLTPFIPDSKRSFLHDVTVENRLIRIFSNGTVLYALRITATIACNMDLTKYPMDRQVCTLQLESWGYNLQDVVFYWTRGNDSVKGLDTLRLAQYSVESYHTSVSEAVYETGKYPKLVLHFALRRNVLFFILETYVPSTLLVVLSWVSFWISQSSVPARTCIGQ